MWIYDEMITVRDAEAVLADPMSSPGQIGDATEFLTGDKRSGQVAAAQAMLIEARRRKGY